MSLQCRHAARHLAGQFKCARQVDILSVHKLAQRNAARRIGCDICLVLENAPIKDTNDMWRVNQAPGGQGSQKLLGGYWIEAWWKLNHQQSYDIAGVAVIGAVRCQKWARGDDLAHLVDASDQTRVSLDHVSIRPPSY